MPLPISPHLMTSEQRRRAAMPPTIQMPGMMQGNDPTTGGGMHGGTAVPGMDAYNKPPNLAEVVASQSPKGPDGKPIDPKDAAMLQKLAPEMRSTVNDPRTGAPMIIGSRQAQFKVASYRLDQLKKQQEYQKRIEEMRKAQEMQRQQMQMQRQQRQMQQGGNYQDAGF